MNKGVKFHIYPNREQQNIINRTLGCVRFIYNKGLAYRIEQYKLGNKANYTATSAMLTSMKMQDDFSFLKEVDSIALQQSLRDLDRAYQNFFKKLGRYPCFKSKHNHRQSYRTLNQGNNIRIDGNKLKLPKLGYIKVKQSINIGHINNVTVERTPTGKYFAVLNIDFEPQPLDRIDSVIGIDVGIKDFYSDSNGNSVPNHKRLERTQRKLRREQRKLSRKKVDSHNRDKQRLRVAKVHEDISNQRNDFLQKLSTTLINVSWGKFFTMLEYKAEWYGRTVVKVPTVYPSSQLCNKCGYKNPLVKNLAIRKWTCPECGEYHDRDVNAAMNILTKGLAMIA